MPSGSFGGAAFSPSVRGSTMRRGSDAFSDAGSTGSAASGGGGGGGGSAAGTFYSDSALAVGWHARSRAGSALTCR